MAVRRRPARNKNKETTGGGGGGHAGDELGKYRLLFENIPDLAYICGADGDVLYLNGAFERLSGRGAVEFIGRPFAEAFEGEDLARVREFHARTLKGESPRFEARFRGTGVLCEYRSLPLRDERGAITGVMGTARDITERKRAEEELGRYRATHEAIFRSVEDAIVLVDLDMTVVEANDAAERLCGVSRSSIGKRYTESVKECAFRCVEALRETLETKAQVEKNRMECHHSEIGPLVTSLNTFPVFDNHGAFCGAVLVIRDETRLVDLERDLEERKSMHNIIGGGRRMQEVFRLIENLADIDTTVLITGESGTGKELVAEALHYTGIRSEGPIVKVNCSALAETLLESELFGHVKGAFTGAVRDRTGRFQMADGGTMFLDEIGDISPDMQLRLLRVLQTKEFERLGDSRTIKVDVRIIAATNQDLAAKVRRGEFREDLYWRLKVVEVDIPPLRDRLEDLPLLEEHFIKRFNKKFGKLVGGLSAEVKRIFMDYHWPGNVRELEHALEHAFIVCRHGTIGVSHLPNHLRNHAGSRNGNHRPAGADERGAIRDALERSSWNKAKAARMLGMSRRTIYRKIARYGISPDEGD
ncbi:MAG: sigma 54-interacting transcriptional regulator [Thermodesulfobacteriota bacterium]